MMNTLYVLVLVLGLSSPCFSQCISELFRSNNNIYDENTSLGVGHAFKVLVNIDVWTCMELCYDFALCQSVDWNLDYKTCRLNTRSATVYPSLRVTTTRTIHVDSEHFPDEVSGDCFNHTCDNTSMCVSGNCVPVLEGRTCDSPPEIPNTEQPSPPGPFPVGYTYNYSSCLEGHEPSGELYTTCQDNGQWTTALFRCIVDQDCTAILYKNLSLFGQDGVYTIYPDGFGIQVYCDMTTELGGWTVIQHRRDNSTDFYRTWQEYKQGFGAPHDNHWIGNEVIYQLSKRKNQRLRVSLQSFRGETAFVEYETFEVGDEASNYILTLAGNSGTAGDAMILSDGKGFTTKDRDNDIYDAKNCAEKHHGAWWYHMCGYSNLNGKYGDLNVSGFEYNIWYFWKNYEPLQKSWMMVKTKM